jgi:beta-fructofuranosidase
MNDPNGVLHAGGVYHLFYQYNPYAAVWDRIHWGHATSGDLVHWAHQPVALAPDMPGLDEAGCWSGCAVEAEGAIHLVYTAATGIVEPDGIASGYLNRSLVAAVRGPGQTRWTKRTPPIIAHESFAPEIQGVRDPVIWREGERWLMSIGAGVKGEGGAALLYRSADLRDWQPAGFLHRDTVGQVWECPQLLVFDGDRALLMVNVWDPPHPSWTAYYSGSWREGRFEPTFFERLEMDGSAVFAPQSTRDAQGRWVMWGWLVEERAIPARVAAGWSGVMSLPRIVTMDADGRARMTPAPEVQALRANLLDPAQPIETRQVEILATLPLDADPDPWISLESDDGTEAVSLRYERCSGTLTLDRSRSTRNQDDGIKLNPLTGQLSLKAEKPLHLHLFLDGSVLEVFAGGGALTGSTRLYPTDGVPWWLRHSAGAAVKVYELAVP